MSLIILTLFLLRLRRPIWITVVPMGFLLFMTTWAMVLNLLRFARDSETMLLGMGGAIFALELWLLFEAAVAVRRVLARRRKERAAESGGGQAGTD